MSRPLPAEDRAVAVRDDVVVKHQSSEMSRRERQRTLAGRAVGQRTGLFVVPEIVAFDDVRGEIVFERLPVAPLFDRSAGESRNREFAGRAATALAAIHTHLLVAETATGAAQPRPDAALDQRQVPLHGDFGLHNVLYLPATDRLAIIDWANAAWLRATVDRGAPEIDLTVFLVSLFHRRLFNAWSVAYRRELACHFLTTYAAAAPHGLRVDRLAEIVAATLPQLNQLVRRTKGPFRALGYRHGMIDLKLFLRRLQADGVPTSPPASRD